MKRPAPPRHLTEAFREVGLSYYRHQVDDVPEHALRLCDGGPACWLYQFDELERPCSGELEVFHFIGRQRVAKTIRPLLIDARLDHDAEVWMLLRPLAFDPHDVDELVELAEWDPRNAAPGCAGHHRRFDSHATPKLKIAGADLPNRVREFIADWGLQADACRRFAGDPAWLQGVCS